MTSDVKYWQQVFLRYHPFFLLVIGRGGASQTRRLITLRSMGWLPPDVRPSGACLTRGTSLPAGLFTPSRVAPHRGGASADRPWKPFRLFLSGVTGTCLAMAPRKPASSRAMATTTWLAGFPRPYVVDRVCTVAHGPSSEGPGEPWVVVRVVVAGVDLLWPDSETPRHLPPALDGHVHCQRW
jgi:hypothetical protein